MSFRETFSEESNPEVNRRVRELAIKKVETEIMILKEKEAKQNAVIDKCNEDIETLIGKAADDIQAKLTDIFMEAVEFEENKSKRIWAPKLELLKNIREREEAKQNALNENRQFRETYARVAQRYSRPQTNSGPPAPHPNKHVLLPPGSERRQGTSRGNHFGGRGNTRGRGNPRSRGRGSFRGRGNTRNSYPFLGQMMDYRER